MWACEFSHLCESESRVPNNDLAVEPSVWWPGHRCLASLYFQGSKTWNQTDGVMLSKPMVCTCCKVSQLTHFCHTTIWSTTKGAHTAVCLCLLWSFELLLVVCAASITSKIQTGYKWDSSVARNRSCQDMLSVLQLSRPSSPPRSSKSGLSHSSTTLGSPASISIPLINPTPKWPAALGEPCAMTACWSHLQKLAAAQRFHAHSWSAVPDLTVLHLPRLPSKTHPCTDRPPWWGRVEHEDPVACSFHTLLEEAEPEFT